METGMKKECKICVNDSSVRNIRFNKDGVCNFCENYLKEKEKFKDYDKLRPLFVERIEKIKGKHSYDAAVGISGGKDSVFVLYELKNKYRLKIKAFTMNNGFLSDKARGNIDKIVKELDVEHEYIDFDKELLKRFYSYSIKKWLVPCIACSYIGYASIINLASKIDAGMIVHGRSPEQMFRAYNEDVFSSLIEAGLKRVREVDFDALYLNLLSKIDAKMDKRLRAEVKEMLFKDVKGSDFREFVAYFLYHPYDEEQIVRFLKEKTSWQVDGEYTHYDCRIHHATKYIYQCAEGRAHSMPELSFLVRDGQISRQEAKKRLELELLSEKPQAEMDELFNYIGKKDSVTLFKAKMYNRVFSKWM